MLIIQIRGQKGIRILNFALLLVVFNLYHGGEWVKLPRCTSSGRKQITDHEHKNFKLFQT